MSINNLTLQKDYGKAGRKIKQPLQPEHLETGFNHTEDNFMSDYLNESINEQNDTYNMAEPKIKEKEIIERIEAFFKNRCRIEDLAKMLRQYRYETVNLAMKQEDESKFNKPAVIEGAYWIHEFCETIAPYFKSESDLKADLDL